LWSVRPTRATLYPWLVRFLAISEQSVPPAPVTTAIFSDDDCVVIYSNI
jgi:hypothetical protein